MPVQASHSDTVPVISMAAVHGFQLCCPVKQDSVGDTHETLTLIVDQGELVAGEVIIKTVPLCIGDRIVAHELRPNGLADV